MGTVRRREAVVKNVEDFYTENTMGRSGDKLDGGGVLNDCWHF